MPHNDKPAKSAATRPFKPRIIAVGGAKGGVGKSLIAANLAVLLSRQGWRSTAVDLDLGAANLHLYLGVWALKHRINDYLDKKVSRLEEIAVDTPHGPRLIGGGSSRLGAANLPFARKLKLMRALRTLSADFVVVDLGGDTAYNILDFYLAADHGIVTTSCDPASYLDAYTFVKMALHRRLTRLFSPESPYRKFRDLRLEALIQAAVGPDAKQNVGIADLLAAARRVSPDRHYLVRQAVENFQPLLLVNQADGRLEVEALVSRFQKVSRAKLGIAVPHVGTIPADGSIARSSKELVPAVADSKNGLLAGCLQQVLATL